MSQYPPSAGGPPPGGPPTGGRPAPVTLVAVLLFLGGALSLLGGLVLLSGGGFFTVIGIVSAALGALYLYAGVQVMNLKEIGRQIATVAAGVGAVPELFSITEAPATAILNIALNGFIIYTLVKNAHLFRKRGYPQEGTTRAAYLHKRYAHTFLCPFRMKRASMALLGALLALSSAPLSPPSYASHARCRQGHEIRHTLEYGPEKVVSIFRIDVKACLTGKATVEGSISREAQNAHGSGGIDKACRRDEKTCTARIAMDHPNVELAEYEVTWSWRGMHRNRSGGGAFSAVATCVATPAHAQCQ